MRHGFFVCAQAAMSAVLSFAGPVSASVLFDSHFDGNSGGIPVGCAGEGTGSVVESGTTLTFQGDFVVWTESDLDVNERPITQIVTEINSTSDHVHVGFVDLPQLDNHFWVKIFASGLVMIKASNVQSGELEYQAGVIDGYTGGAIRLTVTMAASTFSVVTDSPSFSTGPLAYATMFGSFRRADLGHAAKLVMESECAEPGTTCKSVYDRVTVMSEDTTPVLNVGFDRIKRLYR